MVISKQALSGIDIPIDFLQESLNEHVVSSWGLNDADYLCYGRAYRNQNEEAGGFTPEVFIGQKSLITGRDEYRDAYHDDTKAVISFFNTPEVTSFNPVTGENSTEVALIFSVDLERLPAFASYGGRCDEEVRNTIQSFFQDRVGRFVLIEVVTGIENVYAGYSGYNNKTGIRFRDQHPIHCFRVNLSLTYKNQNCFPQLFIQTN